MESLALKGGGRGGALVKANLWTAIEQPFRNEPVNSFGHDFLIGGNPNNLVVSITRACYPKLDFCQFN